MALSLAGALALAGCGADGAGDGPDSSTAGWTDGGKTDAGGDPGDGGPAADAAVSTFRSCLAAAAPTGLPTVDWNHTLSSITALATPHHSAQDVIAKPAMPFTIPGKFSYGSISKDLQDELIEVWIDDCSGSYRLLGEQLSDSDGRIALPVTESFAVGEYNLFLRVKGDDTSTRSVLRIYPAGTRFVVFDIDGTLTTSDSELTGQLVSTILGNSNPPEARADAVTITNLRHDTHNYEILYVSGRPYLLTNLSRRWLADLGMARGTLHVVDAVGQIWPSEGQVGTWKTDYLNSLKAAGFEIPIAYGNATTDIFAYGNVGIPLETTFILGQHGGEGGTVALGEDYTAHVAAIAGDAPVAQPF